MRWEAHRFGCALETAAHTILWSIARAPEPAPHTAKVPPRKPMEGTLEYVRRLAIANRWLSPDARDPSTDELPSVAAEGMEPRC